MRLRGRLAASVVAIVALVALMPAADEPAAAPLLKEVKAGPGTLRVRIPVKPGFPDPMSFAAQVPRAKKKSELIDVKVAFEVMPGQSYVTVKKLESWGYEPGKAKEFVLPELLVPATQVSPKPTKGSDAVIRLSNVKLTVIADPASKDDTVHMADISLSSTTLFQYADRAADARTSFADKFIELTVPAATAVRRPGTDAVAAADVSVSPDGKLVPSVGSTVNRTIPSDNPAMMRGMPVFTYAAVDEQDSYKTPDGKTIPVSVAVSTISNMPSGVMVTLGLARGVKIDFDAAAAGQAAIGVDMKSAFVPGKIKQLRLGLTVDKKAKGQKEQKDIVIKDIPVMVDKNISEGYLLIGQKFIDTYFIDGVYTNSSEGWKLHGRTNPELLFDIKTRKKLP